MNHAADTEPYDAIVVGSGAAGGWAAKELTEAGLSVLLLEAGRPVPETDYPLPARPMRRLVSRAAGLLRDQPVQMRCAAYNARTGRFFVSDRDNPYRTPADKPFNWFRGRQVGGRLHVWGRIVLRLSDYEFRSAARDGHGCDWPLSGDDLTPYYERVEGFLGVTGSADGVASVPDCVTNGPRPLTAAEEQFKRAVEGRYPDRRVIPVRVVAGHGARTPPTLMRALETGRLTLRTGAVVRHVTIDQGTGLATGVSFIDTATRTLHEAHASAVVVCASTIESVRLLLNSVSPAHPRGVGNSAGVLGQCLMTHVMTGLGGPLPAWAAASPHNADADPYDLAHPCGFYVPRFRNLDTRHDAFRRGYGILGGIGRDGATWWCLSHGEMLARAENRVAIDPTRTDAWGVPIADVSCAFSENEDAMARDQVAVMHDLADVAGLPIRWPPGGGRLETLAFRAWRRRLLSPTGALVPGSAGHEFGGARMGADPASSVLNPFNQCWDAKNVFVTDGAAFPTGCSQNSTLTIMALTVRACAHLVREHHAGRLQA